MRKLDSNAHSVFLLYYHLILVIKYRKKILTDPVSDRAREIFEYIAPKYHITLEEWNHDRDHVHIMFRAHPKSELSKLVHADEKIRKQLNLEPGAYVIYISRLRTADGEPVTIERNYFPVKYSFLLEKKFDDNSLFECLQEEAKVRVITSEKQIELCRATAAEAKLMKVKKGAPLLYIKSVAYTYDREPLYAGAQVFNGEVCSLYVCESVEQ